MQHLHPNNDMRESQWQRTAHLQLQKINGIKSCTFVFMYLFTIEEFSFKKIQNSGTLFI